MDGCAATRLRYERTSRSGVRPERTARRRGKGPEEWQDSFAEREAIMAIDASYPYVPAIREAFKDVMRVQNLRSRSPVGEEGKKVRCADEAVEARSMSSRRHGQRSPSMGIGI